MVINTHTNVTSTVSYTTTADATAGTSTDVLITKVSSFSPYGMCPYQMSPLCGTSGGTGFAINTAAGKSNGNQTLNIALNIVKSSLAGVESHQMATCRIYGSMIELTPVYEEMYLTNKIKVVLYNDNLFFSGSLNNKAPGDNVNQIITNGLSRLRTLIIYSFMTSTANGDQTSSATQASNLTPQNSCFSSEPGTLSPYASIIDFNVSLSGRPIYQQNKVYNFENYLDECRGNSINGALAHGLNSGLLSQYDHDSLYGYVVVDLKRHNASDDDISKSVQLQFKNNSKYTMDYIVHIEYEKQINLDCELGSLVM